MSDSIARNEAPIGLVIVHGIGNQRPGTLSRRMAKRLADRLADPVENENPEETAATTPIQRITVGDAPVLVREAHWASLSHPDNPPRVRFAIYILRDFMNTIGAAWRSSPIADLFRGIARSGTLTRAIAGIALVGTGLLLVATWQPYPSDTAFGILGMWLFAFIIYSTYRMVRHEYLRPQHASGWARYGRATARALVAFAKGFFWLLPSVIFATEIVGAFFVLVVGAVAVNILFLIPAAVVRYVGSVMGTWGWRPVRRWVHRVGWVIVVLPVHSVLQVVKAAANLVSIVFTEKGPLVRTASILWWPFVLYFAFTLLTVFVLVLIYPFYLVFKDGFTADFAKPMVVFAACLLLVRVLLRVIDLVLDIGNYHLAPAEDRGEYFERLEESVRSLVDAGCREIHILAHSLGSVISYDWLASQRADGYPVTVLHTIGSPLNKFWYFDHARAARVTDRQGLSRLGGRWTNYWAWSDIVSGVLARYGTDAGGVSNTRLRWLGIALFSHGHYWKNPVVLAGVRREIERSFRGDAGSSRSSDPSENSTASGTLR